MAALAHLSQSKFLSQPIAVLFVKTLGLEAMRFRYSLAFEQCYCPDQRGMHLLQFVCWSLLHASVNTDLNSLGQ